MLWSVVPGFAQRIPRQSLRPAAIQGRVVDENGRGIPGVDVELRRRSESGRAVALPGTRRATTGADGVFRFLELDAGDYGIALTREG
jgi:protocatechuate 3,4-dioxygenase beta subunit